MRLLIVAGDPSGDLHGSNLIRALKKRRPSVHVTAVGGPCMRQVADVFLEDLASRGMTGFWEPIGKIGFLLRLGLRLRRFMSEKKPDALICIDYYGFNRRVLGLAKSQGISSYYYISPQVWASRPGRIKTLKRLVQRMFVIFPFEEKLYRNEGLSCRFVGHPLIDLIPEPARRNGLKAPLRLGLLPGSRASEVKKHLPLFLAAADRLRRQFPKTEVTVFGAATLPDGAYRPLCEAHGAKFVRDVDYKERRTLDIAISSSGTATLENALLGLPMVVVYKLSWPTYAIARAIIRVPYIAMANLLAGRALVPELIQSDATPERIAEAATGILEDPRRYAAIRASLLDLRRKLGKPGAADRAAAEILGS